MILFLHLKEGSLIVKTKSYATHAADKELEPFDLDRRDPGPKDIAIDIEYCGICHSDIHQARNEWGNATYPMVPGHEIVGTVVAVGGEVSRYKVGDTVGIGCLVDSCRKCTSCGEDLEQYCENGFSPTYNGFEQDHKTLTQGGYSSHVVVDESFVLRVPDHLDKPAVAPLLCAGITTYSPLRQMKVGESSHVGVVGLGGLGHMAVKLAKAMGAKVSVFSRTKSKQADAARLGADNYILSSEEAEMQKHLLSMDAIVNTVSAKHDLAGYLQCLKRDGTMAIIGVGPEPLAVPVFPLIMPRRRIIGSLIGGIRETQEMLDFCGEHNITSDIELIEPSQINAAFERVLASDVKYRFVIDCGKF